MNNPTIPTPPEKKELCLEDLREKMENLEKQNDFLDRKTILLKFSVFLVIAVVVKHIPIINFLFDFCAMMIHEIGHAAAAWLGGYLALPFPYYTHVNNTLLIFLMSLVALIGLIHGLKKDNKLFSIISGAFLVVFMSHFVFEERNYLVFLLLFCSLLLSLKMSYLKGYFYFTSLASVLIILQLYLTFFAASDRSEFYFTFAGIAGEFVLSAFFVTLYFYTPSERSRWEFWRDPVAFLGLYTLASAMIDWHKYSKNHDLLPFGTAVIGASDTGGDLNKLVSLAGWSNEVLISKYLTLGWCCTLFLLAFITFKLLGAAQSESSNGSGRNTTRTPHYRNR